MKNKPIISEFQYYGIYCVAVLFTSGTFIGIYDLGWKVCAPLFFFLCFLGFYPLSSGNSSDNQKIHEFNIKIPAQWFCHKNLFVIITVSPIVIYFAITWNQEFPFIGDHDFHLIENYKAALFWIDFKWQFFLFLLTFIFSIRFGTTRYWIPFAGIILMWWSRYDTLPWHHISNAFYIRYPAAGRFFQYRSCILQF